MPALFDKVDGVIGGAERYALELARHMADVVPTTLLSFGSEERQEVVGRLRVRVIGDPWYVRGLRSNPVSLRILTALRDIDVVHCHQRHILGSSLAALACRLTRRRVFVTDLGGGGWDVSGYVSTDRWYHGHLHISQYSRDVYGHRGKSWADVIYGGVDIDKFSPADLEKNGSSVVFVGRLLPHKGVDVLIRALPANMSLEIIGPASDPKYAQDLRALATGKQVTFHHDFDDTAIIGAYRRALCVVLPSVYRSMYGHETSVPELLGQTLLEGMACGAPGVCTDVGSLPEIVENGISGFIVPPNDPATLAQKVSWLRDHPEHRTLMGRAARDRVTKNFTWPAVVRRCLRAYLGERTAEMAGLAADGNEE